MPDEQKNLAPAAEERGERMQRIRVGLTGLAVVLLLVALATVLFNRVGTQAGPKSGNQASMPGNESKDEPLADLGVAPGAPENESVTSPDKAK
jgi:hypothetical protein